MNPEQLQQAYQNGQISWELYSMYMNSIGEFPDVPQDQGGSNFPPDSDFSDRRRNRFERRHDRAFGADQLPGEDGITRTGALKGRFYQEPEFSSKVTGYERDLEINAIAKERNIPFEKAEKLYTESQLQVQGQVGKDQNFFPYINPWGGDLNTNAYMLGMSLGADKGTRGKTAGIISGAGAVGLGVTRNVLSGMGNQMQTQGNLQDYFERRNRDQRRYTNEQTSRNQNYFGGNMQMGGEFNNDPEETPSGKTVTMSPEVQETLRAMGVPPEHWGKYVNIRTATFDHKTGERYDTPRVEAYMTPSDRFNNIFRRRRAQEDPIGAVRMHFEDGGEAMMQEPQQGQVNQDEIMVLAQQLTQEFSTIEEADKYLQEQGIEPEMREMILQVFAEMVQGQQGQQEEQIPKSAVMRDTMSGNMETGNFFRRGGKYPRL
jgi:hypothetical protein